jgi:hypothetical protein
MRYWLALLFLFLPPLALPVQADDTLTVGTAAQAITIDGTNPGVITFTAHGTEPDIHVRFMTKGPDGRFDVFTEGGPIGLFQYGATEWSELVLGTGSASLQTSGAQVFSAGASAAIDATNISLNASSALGITLYSAGQINLTTAGELEFSRPVYLSQTWNSGVMRFEAFRLDITNQASLPTSSLVLIKVNDVIRLNLTRDGTLTVGGLAHSGAAGGKSVVCADTAGQLYRSSSGVACLD